MTHDLRRLRLHGLIEKIPGTNTYVTINEGIRVAVFYTKLEERLLRPLLDAHAPPAPVELRQALRPSTSPSRSTSRTHASQLRLETCHNIERLVAEEEL